MIDEQSVKSTMNLVMMILKNNKNAPGMLRNKILYLPCKPWGRIVQSALGIDLAEVVDYLHKKDCVESKSYIYSIKGHIYKNYILKWDRINQLFGVERNRGKMLNAMN